MYKNKRIIISNNILLGKPRIKGTRVSVEQILACLAEGWSHKKIIKEFDISEEDIKACMEFAHQSISRTRFLKSSSVHKAYA
ncbi:DUF433 domain-containing protein [Candidatus Peregrinibacteria bacterium]|nr:DUF433 domain-containing protein [Candidatus Peregrinibacteria bacterium]